MFKPIFRILTVLLFLCSMDPNNIPPILLAFFYQHQPDPSWLMVYHGLHPSMTGGYHDLKRKPWLNLHGKVHEIHGLVNTQKKLKNIEKSPFFMGKSPFFNV
jgi:hypothetical protein